MSALVIMIIPFWICDEFGGDGRGRETTFEDTPTSLIHRQSQRSEDLQPVPKTSD